MTTPMMQQYLGVKSKHPDGLLLFRMGDFFEMFFGDAEKAARLLNLTLTSRDKGPNAIPMAGVPARSVDQYVQRLVKLGERVVICDQLQDPKDAVGIVERGVTRVITAGTLTEDGALPDRDANYLAAFFLGRTSAGIAVVDLSTAEFRAGDVPLSEVIEVLTRLDPAEIVIPESGLSKGSAYEAITSILGKPVSRMSDWMFDIDDGRRLLLEHLRVRTLDGFGLAEVDVGLGAAGAVLRYLKDTQKDELRHLNSIRRLEHGGHVVLDRVTRASLELVRTLRDGTREGSLLDSIDRTRTSAGARLLKHWVLEPLSDIASIVERQDALADLLDQPDRMELLREALGSVQDIDRLLARLSCGRASARELVALRHSLDRVPQVRDAASTLVSKKLRDCIDSLPELSQLTSRLATALVDDPPITLKEGGFIRRGFDEELDTLHRLRTDGHLWVAEFQQREIERTGISTLKVAFNRVFGWYIEITNVHAAKVPGDYVRRSTVKNAERYITQELKEFESKVLGAEEKIALIENRLFGEIRSQVLAQLGAIQATASSLAELDVLAGLAFVARETRCCRPEVHDGIAIEIREGRHPVLATRPGADAFVPNDLLLDDGRRLVVITGPNMAGKSTYIRQCALLVLLAQVGAYVPAASARIGIVDRIFTRVGASDELARGNSTFMVEMIETASILNHASARSFVILDEVGRGTSTFDGLALAWAITEHLSRSIRCRALFATHYHQLVELGATLEGAANASVAVREWGDEITFLHRIVDGGTDRSFGLHVARLAGLPQAVIDRAKGVLFTLEAQPMASPSSARAELVTQLGLFPEPSDPLRSALKEIDPDRLSPIEALIQLKKLRDMS